MSLAHNSVSSLFRILELSKQYSARLLWDCRYTNRVWKGVFWKRGLFRKDHFLGILENLGILEILENRQTVENKREADHFQEILENLEILEILEIPPVKRPLS